MKLMQVAVPSRVLIVALRAIARCGFEYATMILVQDEFDIQFGMDVTLWVQPAGTEIVAPVRVE